MLLMKQSSVSLVHSYLFTLTLIVNEPKFCDENRKALSEIIEQLIREEIIEESPFESGKYEKSVKKFKELMDYYEQNEILQIEKRVTQQSIWIAVKIEGENGEVKIKEELKKAEQKEAEEMEKMKDLAQKFAVVYKKKKENLKR